MVLMVLLTCLGYLTIRAMVLRKVSYWPAVGVLAGSLFFFKLVGPIALSLEFLGVRTIWLPLGLSYLVARQIDLAQKIASGQIREVGLFEFFEFSLYWPSSIAGPITEYNDFVANRNVYATGQVRLQGLPRVAQGLVRKITAEIIFILFVVKNYEQVLVNGDTEPATLFLFYLGNMLFVYLDFSGYTDIAVGTSRLMGSKLPENFDKPLHQWNMRLFWRHWHMSLTRWVSRIVFMPLSMSVRREHRWVQYYVPILATTMTIGLWHGFQIGWLLWSIHHAIGIVLSDYLISFERWATRTRRNFTKRGIRALGVGFVWYWLMLSYSFTLSSNPVLSIQQYFKFLFSPLDLLNLPQ
jgi:alginate O-acetyltransferase complex protein AlgI